MIKRVSNPFWILPIISAYRTSVMINYPKPFPNMGEGDKGWPWTMGEKGKTKTRTPPDRSQRVTLQLIVQNEVLWGVKGVLIIIIPDFDVLDKAESG